MAAHRKPRYVQYVGPEDYLEAERKAQARSEYHGGEVVAMADAKADHNRISGDIHGELRAQLKGGPCEVFVENMKVRVPECDRYYYPDVAAACGARFERRRGTDSLLNPVLVVEVLSESTETLDRGEKFDCYATLPSLQAYVLVAQDQPRVEVYERQPDGLWRREVVSGLDAVIELPAVGCALKLAEIYARVEFAPKEEAASPEPEGQVSPTL